MSQRTENGFAVFDPVSNQILFYTLTRKQDASKKEFERGEWTIWADDNPVGFRVVPVTITYEMPE